MVGPEILREIVVKISNDRKKPLGTGFFVSENEIVTCYHVVADKSGLLSSCYFVKNDDWKDWIRVEPIGEKCNDRHDYAFLSCPAPIKLGLRRILFVPWDEENKEFRSRGYDCNTEESEGASTVEGKDCRIVDRTSRESELRWQLSTIKKTLLPGRSGSPVWSAGQKAIVGMIDYRAGDESILKEKSMAIPIEKLPIVISRPKGEAVNVPALPVDFLPRIEDLDNLRELVLSPGENKSAITGKILGTGQQCTPCIGLLGMGGIGKSVLAAALAKDDQILEAFPDGVFWTNLGQQPNLPNRQLQLMRSLKDDHRAISDVQDGLGCLRLLLSERLCLIVLDDVWSMNDVRAFDALGPNCHLLITTRDQEIVRGLKAKEFCLNVLSQEDSLKLLALSSGLKLKDLSPNALEVAKECDCLPLALAMVGSLAKAALRRGRPDPWEHILHRLRSADLEKIKFEFSGYHYPNLMRAIEVSVESLEPDEQRRYLDLAVFPEDSAVPEAALQLLWGLDKYDTRDLADHLADRSLAHFNSGLLGLHDLQHDFALKRAGDISALHGRLLDAYRNICQEGWHTGPNDGYFLQHLAYHLLHSGKIEDLKTLALDFRWLEARLEKTEITSLISDFDLLPNDEEMRLCRDSLRLSSHVLMRDRPQIASQLLGRMQDLSYPRIKGLIKQANESGKRPWLQPMTASLMPPGGPLIRTLQGHASCVMAVALMSDGPWAISASDDNSLKIWDLNSGLEIRTLEGHSGFVSSVALISEGHYAVSASWDNTIKIWDLESGKVIRSLEDSTGPVIAVAVAPKSWRAISSSWDKTLKIWDLKSGLEIRTLKGHSGMVWSVAITPDGQRAISASEDKTLKIWDLETGREIQTLSGHAGLVSAVAVTHDGLRAVSASYDCTLKIWDLQSSREVRTLKGHSWAVTAVALTPDNCQAVSASYEGTFKVWDLETGLEMRTLKGFASKVNAIAISLDGRQVVSALDDRTLKVWDLQSSHEMRTRFGHVGLVSFVAVTTDGLRAVSASTDRTLKVWDLKSGKEMHTLRGLADDINVVALMPDDLRVVSASTDRTLKVWDLESGKEVQTLSGHSKRICAVKITQDGSRIVSVSLDGTIKIWNLKSGRETYALKGFSRDVIATALAPDGRHAVFALSDNTLKIWDLESGSEKHTLSGHVGSIRAVALTPDGLWVVSASWDNTLKVWDLDSGKELQTLVGHVGWVNAVAITPDGRRAVSASNDNTLKVWDLDSGNELQTLVGHIGWVNAVAITPDGRRAVSASFDDTLKVWDLETGCLIASFAGESAMYSCAVAPDGLTIVAGEASGRVHFLRLEGIAH